MLYIDNASDLDHTGGEDAVALVSVGGELDYGATPQLRRRLFASIDRGGRHLVLDLSNVTFIDSLAIGTLIAARARLREVGGGSLRVVCAGHNEQVLRMFDIVSVAELIELHPSRTEALAAANKVRRTQDSAAFACVAQAAPTVRLAGRRSIPAQTAARRYTDESADARIAAHGTNSSLLRRYAVDELA